MFFDMLWESHALRKGKKLTKKRDESNKKREKKLNYLLKTTKDSIVISHVPPHKILDKVTSKEVPKNWRGTHAGSKILLKAIKKHQPKYVFCGHIHEGKGKKKVGKTTVYNIGFSGDYVVIDI